MNAESTLARVGRWGFAAALVFVGVAGLCFRDFTLFWGELPAGWSGASATLAVIAAVLALGIGLALLREQTRSVAAVVLLVYVALFWLLYKLPPVWQRPGTEATWLDVGEFGIPVIGAWVLLARSGGRGWLERAPRVTWLRRIFGLAILPVGVSHFVYLSMATTMVPTWLPFREGWVQLTGAAHLAAGLALLVGILPRLAARLEAAMIAAFGLLVWVPAIIAAPGVGSNWNALWVTWEVAAAAAVIAAELSSRPAPAAA